MLIRELPWLQQVRRRVSVSVCLPWGLPDDPWKQVLRPRTPPPPVSPDRALSQALVLRIWAPLTFGDN